MGVIDIRGKGGTVPEPKSDENPSVVKGVDPIQAIEDATYRGQRMRAFNKAAGLEEKPKEEQQKVGIDVGAVVKALAEQNTSLLLKVTEMMTSRPADPLLTHLMDDLKETKEQLQSSDPFEALTQTQQRYSTMLSSMKKDLGLPETMKANVSDMPLMLELERIKGERDERRQQWDLDREDRNKKWDAEREELRRRWVVEDRRWEAEFQFKRQELENSSQVKGKAFGELSDLAQAIVSGIVEERASAGQIVSHQVAAQPPPPPPEPEKTAANFKCDACGAPLYVPDHIKQFTCPKCSAPHDLEHSLAEAKSEQED